MHPQTRTSEQMSFCAAGLIYLVWICYQFLLKHLCPVEISWRSITNLEDFTPSGLNDDLTIACRKKPGLQTLRSPFSFLVFILAASFFLSNNGLHSFFTFAPIPESNRTAQT